MLALACLLLNSGNIPASQSLALCASNAPSVLYLWTFARNDACKVGPLEPSMCCLAYFVEQMATNRASRASQLSFCLCPPPSSSDSILIWILLLSCAIMDTAAEIIIEYRTRRQFVGPDKCHGASIALVPLLPGPADQWSSSCLLASRRVCWELARDWQQGT